MYNNFHSIPELGLLHHPHLLPLLANLALVKSAVAITRILYEKYKAFVR